MRPSMPGEATRRSARRRPGVGDQRAVAIAQRHVVGLPRDRTHRSAPTPRLPPTEEVDDLPRDAQLCGCRSGWSVLSMSWRPARNLWPSQASNVNHTPVDIPPAGAPREENVKGGYPSIVGGADPHGGIRGSEEAVAAPRALGQRRLPAHCRGPRRPLAARRLILCYHRQAGSRGSHSGCRGGPLWRSRAPSAPASGGARIRGSSPARASTPTT